MRRELVLFSECNEDGKIKESELAVMLGREGMEWLALPTLFFVFKFAATRCKGWCSLDVSGMIGLR